MLNVRHSSKLITLTTEALAPVYSNLTTVRWARKPMWMGTAKSKLFRVPKRPQIPVEEMEELKRLYNNYRTTMKSIKRFLENKYSLNAIETADPEQQKRLFEEDFVRCNEINAKWNEQQRLIREKQAEERLAKALQQAEQTIVEFEQQQRVQMQQIEEIVRQEKENSKNFITPENLDEAIDKALANAVDYNYAIDLAGNVYKGRETTPESVEAREKQTLKQ